MRNVKLVLEYDGTSLCGWQRQDNGPTIQQHLEKALARMHDAPTRATGASRTDAGVHARGQVANFYTDSTIPCHGYRRGLNSHLPEAIAVVDASEVAGDFHARFSARGKHYRYDILARPDRSPLAARFAWHRPRPLDVNAMREAARSLVGKHDFSAFRATGCAAAHARREVTAVHVTQRGELVRIDVWGNAFVRNMVRIMAGTLADTGQGRFRPSQMAEIITSRDRIQAGRTAPAAGLTLMRVYYDEPPRPRATTPG